MKYKLVTATTWYGTEQEHEIDGDFDNEDDALEAFGGSDAAQCQAEEDHGLEWYIVEDDSDVDVDL
jgi:hypothetical protein